MKKYYAKNMWKKKWMLWVKRKLWGKLLKNYFFAIFINDLFDLKVALTHRLNL